MPTDRLLMFDIEALTPPAVIARAFEVAADRLSEIIGRDVRAEFAQQIANQIRQRIRSGRDINDQPFVPRSDGSPATLSDSGNMLDALTGIVEGGDMVIKFQGKGGRRQELDAELLMLFHQKGTRSRGTGRPGETVEPGLPARPGFGFTPNERDFILLAMERIWENVTARDAQATLDRML